MFRVIISVTQKHIDNGRRLNCRYCPIALALSEKLNTEVSVGGTTVYKIGKCDSLLKLPQGAIDFISEFDFGHTVHPFDFEVDYDISDNS